MALIVPLDPSLENEALGMEGEKGGQGPTGGGRTYGNNTPKNSFIRSGEGGSDRGNASVHRCTPGSSEPPSRQAGLNALLESVKGKFWGGIP